MGPRCAEALQSSGVEAAHVWKSHAVATSGNVDTSDAIKWAQILKSRAWVSMRLLGCDQNG